MKRLVGLSSQQLETREGVMEGLARNGLAAAVKAVTLNAELVTAATGPVPTISTTASGVTASLAPVELTAATNSWSTYVDAVLYPFLLETYMASAQQTYQFVNGTLHVATPEVIPLTAEDYLRAAVNRLKNVGALLWSSIRDSLAQGYEAGETTHQLAQRIRDVAKNISETRAITIARTEVISAANAASQAQVELGGFSDAECQKKWLATEDERTRATHRLADGQSVGLSQSFSVGGEYLQFPGDPNGRADNVINCRCTVEYVFAEDDDAPLVAADAPGDLTWEGWNAANPSHLKDAKGKWTDTPDGLTVPKWSQFQPHEVEQWYDQITLEQWLQTSPDVKKELTKHSTLFFGIYSPKNKIQKLIADEKSLPKSQLLKPKNDIPDGLEFIPNWEKMTPEQIDTWYKNITQSEWDATDADVKAKLQSHANLYYDIGGFAGPKNKLKMLNAGKGDDTTVTPAPASKAKLADVSNALKTQAAQLLADEAAAKAAQAAKPKATPLHVNTNVIYKQTYADGAVVAVKPKGKGLAALDERIIWNAKTKKFERQRDFGKTVGWSTVDSYGKGEAYKKFSKETGWLTPDSTLSSTPLASAPTPPPVPKSSAGKPISDMTYLELSDVMTSNTSDDLAKFDTGDLNKLGEKIDDMFFKHELSEEEAEEFNDKIQDAIGKKIGAIPMGTTSAPTAPPIVVTPMKEVKHSLADIGWKKEFGANAVAFDAWFAHNLQGKKEKWDGLSSNDRKLVEAAAFNGTIFGYDTPSLTISKWAGIDAAADDNLALHDQIEGMTNGQFAGWLAPNVDQAKWNNLAPETKELIEQKSNTLSAMGYPGPQNMVKSLKANEPGYSPVATPPLPPFNVTVDDSDVSGPEGMTPAKDLSGNTVAWVKYAGDGSGAFIYAVDPNTGGKNHYAGSVDFEDGEVLETKIDEFTALGHLKPTSHVNTPPAPPPPPPVTPATTPALPSTPPPHGWSQHVLANQNVTFVGDIGQPEPGAVLGPFKSVSTAEMKDLQHKMLLLSDKKKWSTEEKNAVGFYGTKTGYQTMNAVLRNDENRLKMFSEPQLSQAVTSAVLVQSSMTPLTESLELHRGTGAQQFGFSTKSVSTDKLKKLQGQTIVDRGFVSTSVVPPTAISYDYAKKPIKVIIKAPKGTPAVYVDSVKPGHGENELLLGAGTNFHVDEVREASAADKALYGAHTEQVVTLTVVPATKLGPKDVSGKGTTSKSATVTTGAPPSLTPAPSPAALTPGGKPIKLNTNTIYKQTYENGAVVAVQSGPSGDGHTYRLVWHEPQKKFFLQLQQVDGAWINAVNLPKFKLSKKDAFDKFKNDTTWVTPTSGDTALGTSGWPPAPAPSGSFDHILPGLQVGSKIKTINDDGTFMGFTPGSKTFVNVKTDLGDVVSMHMGDITGFDSSPSVPTPPPPPKPVKAPKFDAAQLQALHGVPPTLQNHQVNYIWQNFKYGGTPTTLHSQPSQVFKKLHKAVEAHNKSYPNDKINLLQALKIIDERAAKHSAGGNQNAYEKKIVDWLQTPSGKATATKVLNPPTATPGAPGGGSTAGLDTVAGLLSKMVLASDIGTPHTKKATFSTTDDNAMNAMQAVIHQTKPWTAAQKDSLRKYTSQEYKDINNVLRGKSTLDSAGNLTAARQAKRAQDGMRPITQDVLVFRRTGAAQFPGLTDTSTFAEMEKFKGKVFQDKGFLSTSIHKGTWSGEVHIEIEVPAGTPMAYVGGPFGISHHKSEYEMILAAGLRYRVLSIEPTSAKHGAKVRLRVES